MSNFMKKIRSDNSCLFLAIVIFGSVASLTLWLIFILLFSDACTHEIRCISKFLKKIEFTADGLITAIIAIFGLRYVYVQIRQRNRNFKLDRFEKRVRYVSDNIRFHGVKEGYLEFFDGVPYRFVAAWRLDERSLTILIRPLRKGDQPVTIREKLLDVEDRDRWNSRFTIFFNNNVYGEIIQLNVDEGSIEKFNNHDYSCVSGALMYLQQLDRSEMLECQRLLNETGIKSSNDSYLEVPIFTRPAVYHEI